MPKIKRRKMETGIYRNNLCPANKPNNKPGMTYDASIAAGIKSIPLIKNIMSEQIAENKKYKIQVARNVCGEKFIYAK